MPDRVPHNHPTVETIAATFETWGATDRACVRAPADAPVPEEGVVRLVLAGRERRTRCVRRDDRVDLRGAYDTPAAAREGGDAPDRLAEWAEEAGLAPGRTVHLDVLEVDFRYGLRAPGAAATYDVIEPPTDGLADIAASLDGR